jgi:hypothetical protein
MSFKEHFQSHSAGHVVKLYPELRWNQAKNGFCLRCFRASDHGSRQDAELELRHFGCVTAEDSEPNSPATGGRWSPKALIPNVRLTVCDVKISPMPNLDGIIQELRQERTPIDQAIQALTSLNGNAPKPAPVRTMSASARRRIAAAQRARWAKQKGTHTPSGTARPKRRISPAGIARIRAAAKARWAKVRAAAKK